MAMNKPRDQKLFAKMSKCEFGREHISYLGHIITTQGVYTNPEEIVTMINWHVPRNIKFLRGFLGLTGYYRKFVKGYGALARPLSNLLKKNSFSWSAEAHKSFVLSKEAMST